MNHAVARAVRDELEDLHWLGLGDTRALERELAGVSLWVALLPSGSGVGWDCVTVPRAGGYAALAVYTGRDVLRRHGPAAAARAVLIAAHRLWPLVAWHRWRGAVLDPGEPHARALTIHHLARLAKSQRQSR